ncbi:MAG: DUF3987 domain-containing protein [Planctomycetes bacterium]|nr:DUF3987 domain-containing protein [Planctomycetota bacterium]MBU4399164.1 DUF3987 domain-containing protein [Planctomycetota bacterium]
MIETARAYLSAGLCPLPAILEEKRPALSAWKQYQRRLPTEHQLQHWFTDSQPICLLTGAVSGNLELIDFDFEGELFNPWMELVNAEAPDLAERLVIERSQSGGRHVVYRCEATIPGNLKLAQRIIQAPDEQELVLCGKRYRPRRVGDRYEVTCTLIETRGEGGLFLCAPTPGYVLEQGEFQNLPVLTEDERNVIVEAAWALNEAIPAVQRSPGATEMCGRPGDDFNQRGDIRALLARHGWTCVRGGDNECWRRPGKDRGWSATLRDRVFYVFSSSAAPFEPNRAYSPFAVYAMLEHQGDFAQAASALRDEGYGSDVSDMESGVVDISTLVANLISPLAERSPTVPDPGPIPECLFRVPGFIEQVMDFTMTNAPYPNVGLAFCGAMALQSFLAGRKVCTPGDLRPNLYLLALASSGTGKDFPRKVNSRLLFEVGLVGALGDKFASGEGIQDALVRSSAMLFQNDEMDGVLRQINLDRENRRESIPNILLTLYTSANDVYPIRVKAGQKETVHIDQPHLTLFGTATPQYFYESLCQRMLTNGFFARMIVIDVGKRGGGQTPGSARHLPDPILDTARWWAEYQPSTGNLQDAHPEPRVVPFAPEAALAIEQLQRMTEAEYDRAEEAKDEVARTAWSRTCENATKLALVYACSENHEEPVIGLSAVQWATAFAMHQTRRQLFLAATYVAENPFHAECLKLLRKLREAPENQMQRQHLLRAMRCKAADFDQIVGTLLQQGDIVAAQIPTKTKTAQGYQLT